MRRTILLVCIFFASCSSSRMIETNLYFAQMTPDGILVTDAEWNNFKNTHIARVFDKGSTTTKAEGNWYDPDGKKLITESTYVVTNFHPNNKLMSMKIDSLRDAYKRMFRQQSVLRVDKKTLLVSF